MKDTAVSATVADGFLLIGDLVQHIDLQIRLPLRGRLG